MQREISPRAAILIMAFIIVTYLLSHGIYTIESGTVGVQSTFGKYSEEVKQPGLHFQIPVIQKIKVIDTKMHTVHYQDRREPAERDGVIDKPKIVVLDSKNLSIGMEITLQYAPDGARGRDILAQYGENYFEKLINPIVRDVVRDVVSQHQAEEIALKRSSISGELNAKLQKQFDKLPFILSHMQLRHIDLPQIVRTKIEEVQLAKQEEQRLAMIEKQAEKNQNIKTIEAKTKLIEVTTQARAEAEKKRIEAEAKAFQITKEAQATAEANREIADSLSSQLIRYEATKRWNGAYPRMLVSEGKGNLLLQVPMEEKSD